MHYAEKVISLLKGVRYWITFNEPYVLLLGGYLEGCMPPGLRDLNLAIKALKNILTCHGISYDILHRQNKEVMVSVAHNMAALALWNRWNPADRMLAKITASLALFTAMIKTAGDVYLTKRQEVQTIH